MSTSRDLERSGVAVLPGAVERSVSTSLRASLAAARAEGRPKSRQVLYTHRSPPREAPPLSSLMDQWLNPHRFEGEASTRAAAQSILATVEALLDRTFVLFQDLFLVKRAGQGRIPWHQDWGFWPVDRTDGVVLWVPLCASGRRSGGLRFAAGSQALGPCPVVDLHSGVPQDPYAATPFDAAAWPVVAPEYAEGDAVAFSPLVFHASPRLEGLGERPAWSGVLLAPETRWRHAAAPNHPMCGKVPDGALVKETLRG